MSLLILPTNQQPVKGTKGRLVTSYPGVTRIVSPFNTSPGLSVPSNIITKTVGGMVAYSAETTGGAIELDSWVDTGAASVLLVQRANGTWNQGWLELGNVSEYDHFPYDSRVYSDVFATSRWINALSLPADKSLTTTHTVVLSSKQGKQLASYDGQEWATGSASYTLPTTLRLLGSGGYGPFYGQLFLAVFFNRFLSLAEHKELAKNPWQIFEPESVPFYFNTASTSAIANIAWTDDNDVLAVGVNSSQTIALSWIDSNDVISIAGNITTPATCNINWTDANDTIAITANSSQSVALSWTDDNDAISITGLVLSSEEANINWTDSDDSISIAVDVEQPVICSLYWFDDNDTFQFTATSDGITPIVNLVWGGVPQKPRKLKARKAKKQVEAIVDDVIDKMIANAEASEKQRFKAAIDEVIVKTAIKKSMAEARKVVRQQLQKQLDDEDEEDVIFLLTHA